MDHLNVDFLRSLCGDDYCVKLNDPFVREVIEFHRQLDDEAIRRINDNHNFCMKEIEQRMTNCTNCTVCLVNPRIENERCGHSQMCQECCVENACSICDQKTINP